MRRFLFRAILLSLSLTAVLEAAPSPQLRGIWMHATQVKTAAEADAMVAKIDRANVNAAFVLVWYWGGQAYFRTELCPMADDVAPGYDPLEYFIVQCHSRGIEVHAWFVNGAYGAERRKYVLDKHPDWAVDEGTGGTLWYDFGKPQVRRFQSDLMIACLGEYEIDGLHFDHIRYGPQQCYCQTCQQAFASRYGFEPISEQRRKAFPTAAHIAGNTLADPTSAIVLAEFSDGTPAIALNAVGEGTVLLLNWHAEKEMPPAVGDAVRVAIGVWTAGSMRAHLVTTPQTEAEYGTSSLDAARVTLSRLGLRLGTIDGGRIAALPAGSVLILPAVYIISEGTANELERFVRRGGRLLIIDGPVKSMQLPAVQRLTGFTRPGGYINRDDVIRSTGRSSLVPRNRHQIDPAQEQRRAQAWAQFRKEGVTELVRDVYRRAKAIKPTAQITAAVLSSPQAADAACQDWPQWLRERIVDYVIPMAYTEDNRVLTADIAQWKRLDPTLARIVPGLAVYQQQGTLAVTRDVNLVRSQHQLCRQQGARGCVYFSLQYLSDPLVDVFAREFYPAEAPTYKPLR